MNFERPKISHRLEGSTLAYTLGICLLVGVLLSSMVLLFSYQKLDQDKIYFRELAWDNLESGLSLYLFGKNQDLPEFKTSLFDSDIDSAFVKRENWGLFALLQITGVHGQERVSDSRLYGQEATGYFAANLFLEDENRPLVIAGTTKLQGELYLPQMGIRRGQVGRRNFTGKALFQGNKKESTGIRYPIDYHQLYESQKLLQGVLENRYPAGSDVVISQSQKGFWGKEATVISSTEPIYLSEHSFSGKMILIAPQIWVGQACQLDKVLLYARQIHFEAGFKGKVQAFATDTLITGPDCQFDYPSALVVSHPMDESLLELGAGSRLSGMLIHDAYFVQGRSRDKSYTRLDTNSLVRGHVLVRNNLDLKGRVVGSVYTQNFRLRSPGSIYENYLLDAEIGSMDPEINCGMGLVQENGGDWIMIEKLNP